MRNIIVFLLKIYKITLSPILENVFGKGCRFQPSCSVYASEAFKRYGVLIGGALSVRRLLRCHPFSESLYDPVPKELFKQSKSSGLLKLLQ